ncbi:hypothetical protein, partial [Actinoplanes subtropicus]|uniref:hypothetical protein n=1 Tax=Actinoplanes subtropicus TaxID=543632 RepID=UPI001B8084D8
MNADFGGDQERERIDNFTGQACLDLADPQRNGAALTLAEPESLLQSRHACTGIALRADELPSPGEWQRGEVLGDRRREDLVVV